MEQDGIPERMRKGLAWPLRLTFAGILAERLARAFWPLWSLAMAALALIGLGLAPDLSTGWGQALVAMTLALGATALAYGLWRFRMPRRTEALARLDAQFPARPIAFLADHQALGTDDPAARALWQAARARAEAQASGARPPRPDLDLAGRDPYALRHLALVLFLAAALFGSFWRVAGLEVAAPGSPAGAATPGPSWEGWAEPPAYTGKPALYLNEQNADVLTLPAGTSFRLRLYGAPGDFILDETVSARQAPPPASDATQVFDLRQSGRLAILGEGGREWEVVMQSDLVPLIAPDGDVKRLREGRFAQGFKASDDFGLRRAEARITLDLAAVDRRYGLALPPEEIAPVVLDLPLPRRGSRTEVTARLTGDLSKHVLANLPVTLTMTALDGGGQTGSSAPLSLVLPGRRFFDPMAAALIELRRDILWNRENIGRTGQILRALVWQADEALFHEPADLTRLRAIIARLGAEPKPVTPAFRDDLAEELWTLAVKLEDGNLESARKRLERAQDRLEEAIRRGADPSEIAELMEELRAATDDYLRLLAEEQGDEGREDKVQKPGENQNTMNYDQLQKLYDELERLMAEGKTAEAAELMERIRQFLENMRLSEGQGGPSAQSMKRLGETMRRQQDLSDDAFRDMQDGQTGDQPGNPPGQGQGQGSGQGQGANPGQTSPGQGGDNRPGSGDQPGSTGEGTEEGDGQSLADRQAQIRRELEALRNGAPLPGEGTGAGEEGRRQLEEAGRAMEGAEEALREGDLGQAMDRQAEALEALRQGLRELGRAMAEENRGAANSQPGQRDGAGPEGPAAGRDPLGRPGNDVMTHGSDQNLDLDGQVRRRAQELLDEIRRRSGEIARPEAERDYLRRLLDLF